MKILKYALDVSHPIQILKMPTYSRILSCQNQNGYIRLWVIANPENDPTDSAFQNRRFLTVPTGQDFDFGEDYGQYISTVQINEMVWHVFEIENGDE